MPTQFQTAVSLSDNPALLDAILGHEPLSANAKGLLHVALDRPQGTYLTADILLRKHTFPSLAVVESLLIELADLGYLRFDAQGSYLLYADRGAVPSEPVAPSAPAKRQKKALPVAV